ncbi:MAG: hypothetical protein KBD23_02530 [Gammaproteobacteria bacterium]|nr:hypothetical protein [Gammaproteobacteria bacterium]MBP9729001.1 hypothetical protein [Gammaproteobacteria bacterium]
MFSDEEWHAVSTTVSHTVSHIEASASHVFADLDRKLVHYLPSLNEAVNQRAGFNERLLRYKSLEDLQYLLETRCVNPNYNDRGFHALSFTATARFEEEARKACLSLLLQYDVNVNSQAIDHYSYTPLHLLIQDNNQEGAVFFIKKAKELRRLINFSLPARDGCTTLLLAAKKEQEEVALCILEHSTAPEVFMNLWDDQNKTAFDYASSLKQTGLLQKLSALGAKSGAMLAASSQAVPCTFVFEGGKSQIQLLSTFPVNPEEVTMAGQVITFVETYKPKSPRA